MQHLLKTLKQVHLALELSPKEKLERDENSDVALYRATYPRISKGQEAGLKKRIEQFQEGEENKNLLIQHGNIGGTYSLLIRRHDWR